MQALFKSITYRQSTVQADFLDDGQPQAQRIEISTAFVETLEEHFGRVEGTRDSRGVVSLQGYSRAINAADFAQRKELGTNRGSLVFTVNDLFNSRRYVNIYDQPTILKTSMSRCDVRYYKFTLQVPLGKPDATFRRSQRKLEWPDVDFSK